MEVTGTGPGPASGAYRGLWRRRCQGLTSIKKLLTLEKRGGAAFRPVPVVPALALIKLSVII